LFNKDLLSIYVASPELGLAWTTLNARTRLRMDCSWWALVFMPIIPAPQEAQIRRIKSGSQPQQIAQETLSWKKPILHTHPHTHKPTNQTNKRLAEWLKQLRSSCLASMRSWAQIPVPHTKKGSPQKTSKEIGWS
jgi:hypothetical protein